MLVAGSIGLFVIVGLNLGIDFRGGILIEARHNSGPADIGSLRVELESLGLETSVFKVLARKPTFWFVFSVRKVTRRRRLQQSLVSTTLGSDYDIRRTEFVGPTVGAELAEKGLMALFARY